MEQFQFKFFNEPKLIIKMFPEKNPFEKNNYWNFHLQLKFNYELLSTDYDFPGWHGFIRKMLQFIEKKKYKLKIKYPKIFFYLRTIGKWKKKVI